jgi:hypothetical protein
MKKLFKIISRIIFWDFQRGSWQYDLFCIVLILATIFIQPKFLIPEKNNKQPNNPKNSQQHINKEKTHINFQIFNN